MAWAQARSVFAASANFGFCRLVQVFDRFCRVGDTIRASTTILFCAFCAIRCTADGALRRGRGRGVRARYGPSEQGNEGTREQGNEGAREQGNEGAREQGNEGAREQDSKESMRRLGEMICNDGARSSPRGQGGECHTEIAAPMR
jgi:hypothetical protein